ncbi:MAG: ATP-binding cassette domain-containing protein, partial [Spirulina sp. DLM2.Bin59]
MTAPGLAPNALAPENPQVFPDLDVELRQITKQFEGETVIHGVDLQVRRGEFFCILGPSGCGKTTLLRLMAGFETPSAG